MVVQKWIMEAKSMVYCCGDKSSKYGESLRYVILQYDLLGNVFLELGHCNQFSIFHMVLQCLSRSQSVPLAQYSTYEGKQFHYVLTDVLYWCTIDDMSV